MAPGSLAGEPFSSSFTLFIKYLQQTARHTSPVKQRFRCTRSTPENTQPGAWLHGWAGPFPGQEARVVGVETREPLADGEIGEIEVRGPNVFPGYWNRPDATKESFDEEGWFATGDLGFVGEGGYFTISGRAKELIISGGYNVYPREVEEVIEGCPGVSEVAIVGLPDPEFGERVVAVVRPTPTGLEGTFTRSIGSVTMSVDVVNFPASGSLLSRLVAYGLGSFFVGGKRDLGRVLSGAAGWAAVYALSLLARRKRLSVYSIQMLKRRKPDWFRQDLTTLFDRLGRGELKPIIDRRLPLEQAALAQELLGKGEVIGKIVLVNQSARSDSPRP